MVMLWRAGPSPKAVIEFMIFIEYDVFLQTDAKSLFKPLKVIFSFHQ